MQIDTEESPHYARLPCFYCLNSNSINEGVALAQRVTNWKKFINWILFNVCFAFLPLLSVWFFRSLAGKNTVEAPNDFPEILFFSLMVCASTVCDLRGIEKPTRWTMVLSVLESALLLGAVGSSIVYGGLRFATIINPSVSFRTQLLAYSIVMTVILFLLSVVSEIMLALLATEPMQAGVEEVR